jgi:membrane fusion protein, multidrug efflux system
MTAIRTLMAAFFTFSFLSSLGAAMAQTSVETVEVSSGQVERTVRLPGELLPYQAVDLHARVAGFVESIKVDRGSVVRRGDLLATISAPELKAQLLEAEAKVKSAEAQRLEYTAKTTAAQATHGRLKAASETPGAIAGIELVQAESSLRAAEAAEQAAGLGVEAAKASLDALRELERYLDVRAPFSGMITERYAHPGALTGPASGAGTQPLLRLEEIARLRLVVAVPESEIGGIPRRARVPFTVPAFPGATFHGTVARIGRSLATATRTMPVELDVTNTNSRLSPGMYPEVQWPVKMGGTSLLVPASSVVTTTARTFVIRVNNSRAEWVDVRRGGRSGTMVEVFGPLQPGDRVVWKANDELRDGTPVLAKVAPAAASKAAN